MGGNPSLFKGATNPVENVTWYEAREFVKRLSVKTGKSYRLPSEAEWEYAARAGTKTLWSFGDDEKKLPQYAWFFDNSGQHTHPVGELLPNGFGLYDMHGNVSQWVEDCYPETYRETRIKPPADGRAWTTDHCPIRVIRSGSWDDKPYLSSSEFRNCMDASDGHSFLGFRVARTITP
jgi:formylglycine-generating enzyme required for sulfatase activity